jgi:tRNA-dependent cyclodipeptide synthase
MRKPLAIIGMSPGNSYFKDYEIRFLLQEAIERFGRCAIMVADVPAIATYIALGYSPNKARNKAIPKGNNLKNRTRRLAEEMGYSADQVRIIDWAEDVETNAAYQQHYQSILDKFQKLPDFAAAVRETSRIVLASSGKVEGDLGAAIENAIHYLLSEIAFLEYAPQFLDSSRVCYLYHRNWGVYEDYIKGRFDGVAKSNLDFLLLEAPYETYTQIHTQEITEGTALHDTYSRVMQTGILRASFIDYPPVIQHTEKGYNGLFYDLISSFADKHQLKIEWVEETGYGAVIPGLEEGRFDIFCSATWPTPERHRKAALSHPVYYSDVGLWVRTDSLLIGKDWLHLNDPRYHIAITENDITHAICLTDFTCAKWMRLPQMGRVKALLDAVADGDADATMVEQITYEAYAPKLSHPLVNLAADKPIRRYANCFLVGKNQHDFKDLVDVHIQSLIKDGTVKKLLIKYDLFDKGITVL